ncbi:MAG: MCE family protein [Acidimicrobiales bacterium]
MTTTRERDDATLTSVPTIRLPGLGGASSVPRRGLWPILLLAALVVAAVVGFEVSGGTATFPMTAVFAKTPGLFPGAAVNLLGVKVGTVTSVRNVGDAVVVGMVVNKADAVPATAIASFESPTLLGQPDIELSPGYAGGLRLAPHAVIPESRTTEPVSTDQVLKDLSKTLNSLKPDAVGSLVANLAQDLNGEGASLHRLITGAAGTLQLLAAKGDELGQLNGSLAQLTGSLDSRTAEIQSLITDYDTVASVVAGHSTQLSGAINQLTSATTDLVNLLTPNLGSLEQDVGTITTAGRTIDRNLPSIDAGLGQAVLLFEAAGRAYDPTFNWLNLNNQVPPGVTGDYVAGLIRDRLAGVCRRILANEASGLSTTEIATLASCGNPESGFFDPILNNVATVLGGLNGGPPTPPQSPLSMFQQGLSAVPGASSLSGGSPSTPPAGGTSSSGSTSKPTTGSSSSGSSSSGAGSSGSSSGSGTSKCILQILCPQATGSADRGTPGTSAQSATYSVHRPSLTAPAAHLLPPMPKQAGAPAAHRSRHHRHHKPGAVLAAGTGRAGASW